MPVASAQENFGSENSDEIVASEGSIPVRIVGGRLVAAVELSTIHSRMPVNLFIDYESPSGLQLHDSGGKAPQD